MDVLVLGAVALATALATGVGALPVVVAGTPTARTTAFLWGFAGSVMVVAAGPGLLVPAVDEDGLLAGLAWTAAGAVLLLALRRRLDHRQAHLGTLDGDDARRGVLVVLTLFAHSLPEGLALGAAWAGGGPAGLLVVVAIALQNVPEGTVAAIPLAASGMRRARTVVAAATTSAPQVPGALLAYVAVEHVDGLLGPSYGLAAGAMLALVAAEVVGAATADRTGGVRGATLGAVVALGLGLLAA